MRRVEITEDGEAVHLWAGKIIAADRQPADVWAACRCPPAESAKIGRCLRFLQQRLGEGVPA